MLPGRGLFCLLFCLSSACATGAPDWGVAEPQFETVGDAEAIPAAVVTALAQDARGLIWIGTQQGLVRYDGYRFRKFLHAADNPHSLSGDYVNALWAAKDGRLWIGTNSDGVSVFDPASERFENYRHDANDQHSLAGGAVWALTGDVAGGIWVATDQGLDYLIATPAGQPKKFTHFNANQPNAANPASAAGGLLDNKVLSLLLDKQGRLWVGSNKGLQRLAQDGKQFETVSEGQAIRTLFQAADGKLWLGSYKHGAAWLQADGVKQGQAGPAPQLHWLGPDKLGNGWIEGIAQVQPDQIWLASYGGGISIVAAKDGQVLQQLHHDPALASSLALDSIKPMLLDRAGWLWIGTWGGGLQRMDAGNRMLRILRHSPTRPEGLSHAEVLSILELENGQMSGQILMGTNGNGIDIIDRGRGLVGGYRHTPGKSGGLPDPAITALAQSRDGAIWAGTQQSGVVRQLTKDGPWLAVPGLPNESVIRLMATRDGGLWAATNGGAARWKPGEARPGEARPGEARPGEARPGEARPSVARFETVTDLLGQPMSSGVTTMAEDDLGRIWLGTDEGLWVQEPGAKGLRAIHAAPGKADGLVSDSIIGLLFDSRKRLWLATDKGLERLLQFDAAKVAHFEHVSARLKVPGKSLGGNLMEDASGRIWTSDYVIDPQALQLYPLRRAEGMDIGAGWNGSFAQTRDGLMLFGGSLGVALIDPTRFKAWDYAPPLVALELKINGQAAPPGPLAASGATAAETMAAGLVFDPGQRTFSLEFSALDYSDPRFNRYQYRLQGEDKDWIDADFEHRSASYGNLGPGQYTLQIRGSNRLGEFSRHELAIGVRVLPAWWQTWWCRLLALLAIGGSASGFYYWRVTRLRNIIRSRTATIAAAHDKLASTHQALEAAHGELAAAHQHLKETQNKLVQSEKMASLGALVAGIAHEVNTPLGTTLVAISGTATTLHGLKNAIDNQSLSKSQLEATTSEAIEYAELALRTATRAADLISTFKTIAVRVDNEQSVSIDLALWLADSVSLLRTRLAAAGVQLQLEVPPGIRLEVVADALQEALIQIYANVLDHAFCDGFCDERQGLLCIKARQDLNGDITIMISDNGQGIAAKHLAKVFDPFFTTKSGVGRHVGLGLHVAFNHVTQRLKGEIGIASTKGQGTTVTILLKQGLP
jgi:ligand-binding sensor domain-containing protein/signal transduction histidine kinase